MYNLSKLISEKGYPDALIDHHDIYSPKYAIYEFEEVFVINHNGKSVINNKELDGNPFTNFQKILNSWKKSSEYISAFGFISYDNAESAQLAISNMHGYPVGSKKLKVELKKSVK